ncbi:MAG TPA: HPr family phosphocarrier protein [Ferrovibrio sp.]|jgi:phosphocarrier protein HPr|uniref:HPr family phosphocarrier protein n=1 Tax=Ferrovibrio sp. TaxID=1917215 RepID=UPI002B4B8258|nr:HPr family phosphocarrier protein [Ferrovibrio sp.]HLT76868.1 HPr family phosphocarrier protein [Ferrovibrio sp.]
MDAPARPLTRSVMIVNQRGLHARAAAKFVQVVARFPQARIQVHKDGQTVNGESIMGLMMLAGTQGSSIEITASGPDATPAMEALVTLVESKFGEAE